MSLSEPSKYSRAYSAYMGPGTQHGATGDDSTVIPASDEGCATTMDTGAPKSSSTTEAERAAWCSGFPLVERVAEVPTRGTLEQAVAEDRPVVYTNMFRGQGVRNWTVDYLCEATKALQMPVRICDNADAQGCAQPTPCNIFYNRHDTPAYLPQPLPALFFSQSQAISPLFTFPLPPHRMQAHCRSSRYGNLHCASSWKSGRPRAAESRRCATTWVRKGGT